MNGAGQAASRRKWQRSHLEIGFTKALKTDGRANGPEKYQQAHQPKCGRDDVRGVLRGETLGDGPQGQGQKKHVRQDRGDPPADDAGFVFAFDATGSPILTPEPGGLRIRRRLPGFLFLQGIAVQRSENQAAADQGEYGSKNGAADPGGQGLIRRIQEGVSGEKAHAQETGAQRGSRPRRPPWMAWSQAIFSWNCGPRDLAFSRSSER